MYRIFAYLFGWEYIILRTHLLGFTYIRRVKLTPKGEPYVVASPTDIVFLLDNGVATGPTGISYDWDVLT